MSVKNLFLFSEIGGSSTETDLFHEIFFNFPDMIHSVDDNGKICAFNKKATELLGYSPQELMGKDIFEIYAPEIRDLVTKGLEELKNHGHKIVSESKLITKKGEIIDVEIRSLSLYDKAGSFVKTLSIVRDIRELKHLKAGLVQQAKLASIGELACGIMHDIRNPLSVIYSYSEMVETLIQQPDPLSKVEKIKTILPKIQLAANKIEKLTNNLREFSRISAQAKEKFLLKDLINESILVVESKIKKNGIDLINECAQSDLSIIGRFNRLEQVIMNLLSNAADACSEIDKEKFQKENNRRYQGEIVISSAIDPVNSNEFTVTIKDNGPGIKPENLEQIFTAFFTTKPKNIGTGLGLSICSGIIKEEDGKISVKSELGKGASFSIQLPINQGTN